MKIKIGKNRSVYPYRIKVSNQYENKTNSIEFDLDVPNGNKYLFVEIDGRTIPYPLENKFEISSGLSWTAGEHRACVVVSNVEIKDTINKEDTLFISDEFVLVVDKNFINPDDVAGGGLPEPLKILYDDLMSLKNAIEKKLQNGEFDGESAYQIAVRLGFKGTEQEWIDSLRYDHSEEFQQIALQVEQKATDAENAAQSASEAAQSASESKESAAQAAQSAIEGANSAKESANSALEGATSATAAADSAKQSASSASGSAQSAEEAATSAKEGATSASQSANSAKESADSAAQSAESASQGAASAEQAKTYASEALQSKNDSFISAQEAKTAEVHAKTSEANAKTSETNSKLSETNAKTSELNAQKSAESIQASAEQIEQNKLDIEDLRNNPVIDETVLEKLAIKDKAQGNPVVISDSADWRLQEMNVYGQSTQDGEPSVDNPVPIISKEVSQIKVTGKNLANIQEFEKVYYGNTFEAHYEDDKITYSGADDRSGCGIVLNQTFETGQYTIHAKGVVMIISDIALPSFEYNEYWNGKGYPYFYKFTQLNQKISFNSDIPFKIGFIGGDINTEKSTVSGTMEQIQIELSSEATSYEKYKEQTITLSEPITLRGLTVTLGDGNIVINGEQYISDCIKEKDGIIGVERNLNELLVSSLGSTKLNQGVHTNGQNYLSCITNNPKRQIKPMSNRYIGNTFTMKNNYVYVPSTNGFVITDSRFIDKETAISIITEEQTKVVYVLETPTFEPLPEADQHAIKALKSYYPNTVIQTGAFTEVEYVADPKLYIDKKLQPLNTVQSKLLEIESKV